MTFAITHMPLLKFSLPTPCGRCLLNVRLVAQMGQLAAPFFMSMLSTTVSAYILDIIQHTNHNGVPITLTHIVTLDSLCGTLDMYPTI